jgi:acyl carrier protein
VASAKQRPEEVAVASDRVEAVVREALKLAAPQIGPISGDTHLASELGLDSAQVMDMIMEIEDRLDISIPVASIAEAHTLDQLCDSVRRVLEAT